MCAVMAGLPVTIECRDQSVPRQKAGSGSTAGKEAAPLCSTHSGLGGGAYSVQSGATILPGCCPQLAGSNRINIPVPPKSAQVAPRPRNPAQLDTRYRNLSKPVNHLFMPRRSVTHSKLMRLRKSLCVRLPACITRDREPQLAAGGG